MEYKEIISRRNYKAGYVVIKGIFDDSEWGGDGNLPMEHAETPTGDYIGSPQTAYRLCKKYGIKPEKIDPSHNICSIGFCEGLQKWYGWSHRAMFGFGVGSQVKKGDIGYVPTNWEDFVEDAVLFWTESGHENITAEKKLDEDGYEYAMISWTYTNDVPNEKIRGQISGARAYPPKQWGNGEWTAKNLEDARQMAVDFANAIS